MTDRTSLLFVRHMETTGNCSDPLLSDQGRQEMNELLTALRKYPISRVYSSDLWRAVAPAEIISKTLGVPRKGSSSLREIRSGIEVPRRPNATQKASNVEDLDAMDAQARIAIERFEERIAKAVDDVVAENENSHVVVVTHSETIRAACQHLLELPLSSCDIPPPADGGLVILTRDSSGIWYSET